MNADVARCLARMETETSAILDKLSGWRAAQLRFRIKPEHWSALMVIDHLARVDACAIEQMQETLRLRRPMPMLNRPRCAFLVAIMETRLRVKVPRGIPAGVLPQHEKDLGVLIKEWRAARAALRDFIERLTPGELAYGIFRHPVSGVVDARGAMRFIAAHIRHHGFQIDRIKAHRGWANA